MITKNMLDEQNRLKLDGIVAQMSSNKEADSDIQSVVNDFKQKYTQPQSFVDKLFLNNPLQGVPKENDNSVGSFIKNFGSAAYSNVKDPLTERMNKVSDRALETGQSKASNLFQSSGAVAGAAFDLSLNKGIDMIGEGITGVQNYAKKYSDYVPSSVANYKNELPIEDTQKYSETSPIIKGISKAYNYMTEVFPEENPTLIGNIEAGLNLAGILPGSGTIKATGKALGNALVKTGATAVETVTPLAKVTKQAIVNKINPSNEILNAKVDKEIVNIYKGTTGDANKISESAFKAKKGLDQLVRNADSIAIADINAPLGKGVTKTFNIKKATGNEILAGVFSMDKKIATIAKEAANNATKEGITINVLPAQKIIAEAHNAGKIGKATANNLLKQLESLGSNPTKAHDWIQEQVNIKYFTKAGSLEDTQIAKLSNEAAETLRKNLDEVVDRMGYAEAFGNNQELKRMIVIAAKKANKSINFGDISTDAGLAAAISVVTSNPGFIAGTVVGGLLRGTLSNMRNQSGIKSVKKAAGILEKMPAQSRMPFSQTKIDYSLPRLPAGAIPLRAETRAGSSLVTNTNADARTMNKTLRLPAPTPRIITPNTQGTPNPLGRAYTAGGETARIGGMQQRLPTKESIFKMNPELKVVPDTLKGITEATTFDKMSLKEKNIITEWLNKLPDEYLTNKQEVIKNQMDYTKGTIETMEDVYHDVLSLSKYISKKGKYKGEFRFEDGSNGKFAKTYDTVLSNAFNQYSTNGKLTESEMIDKYFSITKSIAEQKESLIALKEEYKKTEALQPYKKAQLNKTKLPPIAQTTTKASVINEGNITSIPKSINNVIKKSPDVIKSSILPKGGKSTQLSTGALSEVKKDIAKYTNTNVDYVKDYTKNMSEKQVVKLSNDLSDMPIKDRMQIVDNIVSTKQSNISSGKLDLVQEAKKYKSAEDFVKAQGVPVYHGTNQDFKTFSKRLLGNNTKANSAKEGTFFTSDFSEAQAYSDYAGKSLIANEKLFDKKVKKLNKEIESAQRNKEWSIAESKTTELEDFYYEKTRDNPEDNRKVIEAYLKNKNPLVHDFKGQLANVGEVTNVLKKAKEEGYDSVILKNIDDNPSKTKTSNFRSDHTIIFDVKHIKTKSQLEQIWRDANKPSIREAIKANKGSVNIGSIIEDIKAKGYKNTGDLTTKILKSLEGKTTVSKQYILDSTNRSELKKVERNLTRQLLDTMPDGNIDVNEFAKKLTNELLPLKVKSQNTNIMEKLRGDKPNRLKHENVALPDELRGEVKNYDEKIYESPIATYAGDTHFGSDYKNYFGHTRIEDMADNKTRRVIEVQSDLYQKKVIEKNTQIAEKYFDKADELAHKKEIAKLQQYNNPTAHFRMIREEIKKAAQDGKTKLQFPTGETAMKIEGLGETSDWRRIYEQDGRRISDKLDIAELRSGEIVHGNGDDWVIVDVLDDGKFTATPKRFYDNPHLMNPGEKPIDYAETFDISGKVDTNNPIYEFYEKEVQKYLNKYGGTKVIDNKGVSWIEIPIKKEQASIPVEAFGLAGLGVLGSSE